VWGAVLAGAAVAVAVLGGWALTIALALVAALVAWEWASITIDKSAAATAAIALPAAAAVIAAEVSGLVAALAIIAVSALAAAGWLRSAWPAIGVAYAGLLGVALVLIRDDPGVGLEAMVFVLAVVWATDTAAYFAGRALGGPKLWPAVSPNKTWSGAIGGALAALAAGSGVVLVADLDTGFLAIALLALLISVAAQFGDLYESAIKRRFGTKDAGSLIPGHGGVMDRVDGLTFASVSALLVGALRPGDVGAGLLLW